MKRIPYLIVGDGKLAKHLSFYLKTLKVPFHNWSRKNSTSFVSYAEKCDKVLLAINDNSIEPFIIDNRVKGKIYIHFSGVIETKLAESAHPLMTFAHETYAPEFYSSIPFITIKGRERFNKLFPELNNPNFEIEASDKVLYHAWCSMAGNFTSIIWTEFFRILEDSFGINKKVAFPYLQKIFFNLTSSEKPLTGPLSRGDTSTVQKHMFVLENEPISNVYKAFVEYYNKNVMRK
jgi:predicted short-subunit dehydrogenase-like oxidoreductase (DUF2520 family)